MQDSEKPILRNVILKVKFKGKKNYQKKKKNHRKKNYLKKKWKAIIWFYKIDKLGASYLSWPKLIMLWAILLVMETTQLSIKREVVKDMETISMSIADDWIKKM